MYFTRLNVRRVNLQYASLKSCTVGATKDTAHPPNRIDAQQNAPTHSQMHTPRGRAQSRTNACQRPAPRKRWHTPSQAFRLSRWSCSISWTYVVGFTQHSRGQRRLCIDRCHAHQGCPVYGIGILVVRGLTLLGILELAIDSGERPRSSRRL